ncbi:hypothetical protein PV10_07981 [Exophiala mesophila]|uniref:Peroxisomal biogenesis factor 11 n=1 Tax=Exophiala mesophila TaxID=212818 RepID=A0A0D1XJB7_EXOME|nr:uncharacterized protein PV10_07981 [Exophiala mesophila]KIV88286.1 hypothetical protein PV10_07981 [Exophiala mesophila]
MLSPIAKFTNDPVGIDKALKFFQFSLQAIESLSIEPTDTIRWRAAKGNINTARRFLRLFKWIDCFTVAQAQFQIASTGPASSSIENETSSDSVSKPTTTSIDATKALLNGLKYSLLGMYLFMEMFVITDAIALTSTTWSGTVQVESLKIWGYSLLVSIIISLYELINSQPEAPTTAQSSSVNEKASGTSKEDANVAQTQRAPATKQQAIFKQLAVDLTDFVVPLYVAHWYPITPLTLGVAGSINGLLGTHSAWYRLNG